jgi:hypothetical protein
MTVGIEVFDNSGNLQASSEVANYFLASSGTVSFSSGASLIPNNGAPYYRKQLVAPDANAIIAIQPTANYGGVERMPTISGVTYFNMIANNTSTSIPYKIYTAANPSHTDNFGLALYDASGNVTFTSSKAALQLKSLHDFAAGWSEGTSVAVAGIQADYVWISGNGVEGHIGSTGFPNTYQTNYPLVKLETNLLKVGSNHLTRTYGGGTAGGGPLTVARVG